MVTQNNNHIKVPDMNGAVEAVDSSTSSSNVVIEFEDVPQVATSNFVKRGDLNILPSDMSEGIQDVFSRPYLLSSTTWTTTLTGQLYPYSALASVPFWLNKAQYFTNFRANLHVRVVCNGTPFHYGRAFLAWLPFFTHYNETNGKYNRRNLYTTLGYRSFPCINIDPSSATSQEMVIPFLSQNHHVNITSSGANLHALGALQFTTMAALAQVGQASANPIDVSVYIWFTEVDLRDPTSGPFIATSTVVQLTQNDPKATEQTKPGPVSSVATTIQKAADILTTIPLLGPFARATSFAAGAVADIASIFGFSRPIRVNDPIFTQQGYSGLMSVGIGRDSSRKFNLDPLAEVPVGGTDLGLVEHDEMSIRHITSIPGIVGYFTWATSQVYSTSLFVIPVTPVNCLYFTAPGTAYMPSPTGHISSLYKYWRGSLVYRFEFISSPMLRGRVQIRYVPQGVNPNTSPGFSDPVTRKCIVDLSESTTIDILVGWANPTPVLSSSKSFGTIYSTGANGGTYTYNSDWATNSNGALIVEIVNVLSTTLATAETIYCYVSLYAGPDFELAVPSQDVVTAFSACSTVSKLPPLRESKPKVCHIGGSIGSTKDTLQIFGERQLSTRTLLKRYQPNCYGGMAGDGNANYIDWTLTLFNAFQGVSNTFGAGLTSYANFGAFLAPAYVGQRGSVRYKIFIQYTSGATSLPTIFPSYVYVCPDVGANLSGSTGMVWAASTHGSNFPLLVETTQGVEVVNLNQTGLEIQCLQMEPTLFQFVQNYIGTTTPVTSGIIASGTFTSTSTYTMSIQIYVAAADDYSNIWYLGAPLIA